MDDPAKVLTQLRNYVADGRLEISEVMAEELTDYLLSNKNRDIQQQELVVLALRDLANILELRGKWDKSLKAGKKLSREVKTLKKFPGRDSGADRRFQIEDALQIGRIHLNVGNLKKAIKQFSVAGKHGYIEPYILSIIAFESCKGSLKGASKSIKQLISALSNSGPVSVQGDGYILVSANGLSTDAHKVITSIERWLKPNSGLNQKIAPLLRARMDILNSQINSIVEVEQAANAKLKSAIDSLLPTVDYHEYSKSSR